MKEIHNMAEGTLCWLGGASFLVSLGGKRIGIDLYLTNDCENPSGEFKRISPRLVEAENLKLDFLIATHDHGDHFDMSVIPTLIKNGATLIGPDSVMEQAKKLGVGDDSLQPLNRGEEIVLDGICFRGVFCDHGTSAPDAIGIIMSSGGKSLYFAGDTAFTPGLEQAVGLNMRPDVLLVPINGRYGNADSKDAAYITAWVKPKMSIPCHFWMFVEHGGNPSEFLQWCAVFAPDTKACVPAISEIIPF